MNIKNYTPHEIVLCGKIYPSEGIARVSQAEELIDSINGVPVKAVKYGEVTGLPEETPETIIIVSSIVGSVAKRSDLYTLTDFIRNEKGQITGANALVKN